MKQSNDLLQAVAVMETVQAIKVDGFYTQGVFCVKGRPGLWRRVPRAGASLRKKRSDSVLGHFNGQIVELVRDMITEEELAQAGLFVGEKQAEFKNLPEPEPPKTELIDYIEKQQESKSQPMIPANNEVQAETSPPAENGQSEELVTTESIHEHEPEDFSAQVGDVSADSF